jgi:hypothetical protein
VSAITVEEADQGPARRPFLDLPFMLGHTEPEAAWLLGRQRRRLASRRHSLSGSAGEAGYFLARSGGRPVGRITGHIQEPGGQGWFGFLVLDGPGDADVARALLGAAARWLEQRGCETLTGPMSFTAEEEAGVLVEGHSEPLVTARAWTPPWYASVLSAAGLSVYEELASYRINTSDGGDLGRELGCDPLRRSGVPVAERAELVVPRELAPFTDPALLLALPDGGGAVVAVPDVGRALGAGRVRGAWSLARRARRRSWEGCVVIGLDGPEEVLIGALCAAARRAGYQWVLSPWGPPGAVPVLRHRLYTGETSAFSGGPRPGRPAR